MVLSMFILYSISFHAVITATQARTVFISCLWLLHEDCFLLSRSTNQYETELNSVSLFHNHPVTKLGIFVPNMTARHVCSVITCHQKADDIFFVCLLPKHFMKHLVDFWSHAFLPLKLSSQIPPLQRVPAAVSGAPLLGCPGSPAGSWPSSSSGPHFYIPAGRPSPP